MKTIKLNYSGSCDIAYAARLITLTEQDFIAHPNAKNLNWLESGMEEDEDECKNKVPQEGIVIRVGKKAYKLKTIAHLLWKQEWSGLKKVKLI
jgi:hypothetical protein